MFKDWQCFEYVKKIEKVTKKITLIYLPTKRNYLPNPLNEVCRCIMRSDGFGLAMANGLSVFGSAGGGGRVGFRICQKSSLYLLSITKKLECFTSYNIASGSAKNDKKL
jgi:hypothetical protein